MADKREGRKEVVKRNESAISNIVLDLQSYQETRKAVLDFVKNELKDGVDYGLMYDKADKPSLLKPGAEKVCMLLRLEPIFTNDTDTWRMYGEKEGVVCLNCYLLTPQGKKEALKLLQEMGIEAKNEIYKMVAVAEGRGAGWINEKKTMNVNSLIKIVEKRALVDAVLRIAGLSELYTQDGEVIEGTSKNQSNQFESNQKNKGDEKEKKIIRGRMFELLTENKDLLGEEMVEKSMEWLSRDHTVKALVEAENRLKTLIAKAEIDAVKKDVLGNKKVDKETGQIIEDNIENNIDDELNDNELDNILNKKEENDE